MENQFSFSTSRSVEPVRGSRSELGRDLRQQQRQLQQQQQRQRRIRKSAFDDDAAAGTQQ